jgi:pre-rRNA-processing protein IPI3
MLDMLQVHHTEFRSIPLPSPNSGPGSIDQQAKIADLEAELARMREQLGKAKGVNDMMWETVVQHVVQGRQSEDQSTEGERNGKKSRLS